MLVLEDKERIYSLIFTDKQWRIKKDTDLSYAIIRYQQLKLSGFSDRTFYGSFINVSNVEMLEGYNGTE